MRLVFHLVGSLLVGGLASLAGCQNGPQCTPAAESELDYARPVSWLCHPDKDRADDVCFRDLPAVEALADGSVVPFERPIADDPPFDCFYVYPTLDLRTTVRLKDNLSETQGEQAGVETQFARFAEVCRPFAPLYRQVTVGAYLTEDEEVQACFDSAYGDIEAAFDAYLRDHNQGRGIVLVGHSQGAQILSRLLRERFDDDAELRERLVGAFPIGWPMGVEAGSTTGGSTQNIPVCTSDDETGCIVTLRSFAAGNQHPQTSDHFREGDDTICVHPASPGAQSGRLSAAYVNVSIRSIAEGPEAVDPDATPIVLYRDFFSAQCLEADGTRALEVKADPVEGDVRQNPYSFDGALLTGANGIHVIEFQLIIGDLIARAQTMYASWAASGS